MSRGHRHQESREREVAIMLNEFERLAGQDGAKEEKRQEPRPEHERRDEPVKEPKADEPPREEPKKTVPEVEPNSQVAHMADARDFDKTHRTTCPECGTITAETICNVDGVLLHRRLADDFHRQHNSALHTERIQPQPT